mmetsp:Transcript_20073/g.62348  ORF Transcript_20073/g.62348 Transcript_20073/m.62348 type:complete len:212 (+) Transcript_20073:2498-3133(+)
MPPRAAALRRRPGARVAARRHRSERHGARRLSRPPSARPRRRRRLGRAACRQRVPPARPVGPRDRRGAVPIPALRARRPPRGAARGGVLRLCVHGGETARGEARRRRRGAHVGHHRACRRHGERRAAVALAHQHPRRRVPRWRPVRLRRPGPAPRRRSVRARLGVAFRNVARGGVHCRWRDRGSPRRTSRRRPPAVPRVRRRAAALRDARG